MPEPAKPQRRYVRATIAGGAGGLVALLFFLLEERPQLARLLLERVVIAWGPQFIIVLLLIIFFYLLADRYVPRLITAQSETALALQHLAGAVEQLLSRDNAFQREQDVLLNHVARRVDSLHRLLESHHRALNGRLARLSRLSRRSEVGAKPKQSGNPGSSGRKSRSIGTKTLSPETSGSKGANASGLSRRSGVETPPALSEPSGDPACPERSRRELVEGSAAEGSLPRRAQPREARPRAANPTEVPAGHNSRPEKKRRPRKRPRRSRTA